MKTLQNNFTTPEQSKRLLELGLPADSADCYWNDICDKPIPMHQGILYSDKRNQFRKVNVPVWSVGRLIEILRIVSPMNTITCEFSPQTTVEHIVEWFESDDLDFSKLEE